MPDLSGFWPEWKAEEKIGEGSFGKVYRCVRNEYGISSVGALKVISIPQTDGASGDIRMQGMSADSAKAYYGDIVKEFSNEIALMVMLKGAPNVVSVENYKIIPKPDGIGSDIYILMEYLKPFIEYSSSTPMGENDVIAFGIDMCKALEVCHKRGVIHRDIKPDNIFVDDYGNFKLGDFGVARRLENSLDAMSKKGTCSFMAPEVYHGERYDFRVDIYSLGMVLFKLLNKNRDPFVNTQSQFITNRERQSAFERKMNGEPLPMPVKASEGLGRTVLKACEYDPKKRHSSATELRRELEKLLKGESVIAEQPEMVYPAGFVFPLNTDNAALYEPPKQEPPKNKDELPPWWDTGVTDIFGRQGVAQPKQEAPKQKPPAIRPPASASVPFYPSGELQKNEEKEKKKPRFGMMFMAFVLLAALGTVGMAMMFRNEPPVSDILINIGLGMLVDDPETQEAFINAINTFIR